MVKKGMQAPAFLKLTLTILAPTRDSQVIEECATYSSLSTPLLGTSAQEIADQRYGRVL